MSKYLDDAGLLYLWGKVKAMFAPASHVDDKTHVPLVIGTQTESTGSWTGNAPTIDTLQHGQTIKYWLPYAGTGDATLNLTLADGTTTGPIPVYYRASTRMTTHVAVSNIAVLTYLNNITIGDTAYTGWWLNLAYYKDTDTVSRIRCDSLRPVAGDTIIYGRNIVLMDGDGVFRSITRSNSTNTSHTCATQGFQNPAEMFYYSYSNNVAAGATMATNYMWSAYNALDFRYNSNCGTTLTKNEPIYLIFEHRSDGLYYLVSSKWWTQDLPTSEDGKIYVYVGHAYSTSYYNFAPSHPMLWYHNGKVVPYAGPESGGSGGTDSQTTTLNLSSGSGQSLWEPVRANAYSAILTVHGRVVGNNNTGHNWSWLVTQDGVTEPAINKIAGDSDMSLGYVDYGDDMVYVNITNNNDVEAYSLTISMRPISGTIPTLPV